MMARPRGELDVAQLPELAPHRGHIQRDRKFVMKPLRQIDQPPANNTVDRRDGTLLDNLYERTALRIGKDSTLSGGLAIEQAVRAAGIEPDDPIANNLQRHTDDLGSLTQVEQCWRNKGGSNRVSD